MEKTEEKLPSQETKAKEYNRKKIFLAIVELVLSIGLLLFLLLSGLSTHFSSLARSLVSDPYGVLLIFVFLVGLVEMAIFFPMSFYAGYILEHQYRLSNQTLPRWLWEEIKGLAVSTVLLLPLLLVFYYFLRTFKEFWWIPVGFVFFLFSILLAKLAPLLIFPLFYKFKALEDFNLRENLLNLCQKVGLKVEKVLTFNLSKNTKKANAGFAGLGRTRRIILADTLLENFSADEIASVFSHELGHYRYGHLWKGIVVGFVSTFVGLWITSELYRRSLAAFDFAAIDQVEALPLLALYLVLFGVVVLPLQNLLSRHFESQADMFSITITGDKESFISSMKKLTEMNLADAEPHPVVEFFFYSHPPIGKRIKRAQHIEEPNTPTA